MTEFSYIYGLDIVGYLALAIGSAYFLMFFLNSLLGLHYIGWMYMFFLATSLSVGVMLLVFPIVVIVFQLNQLTFEVISSAFISGTLVLMIVGIIVGYKLLFFRNIILIVREISEEWENEHKDLYPTLFINDPNSSEVERSWESLAQYLIFGISICTFFYVKEISEIESSFPIMQTVACWTILFFVDDWIIISECSLYLQVPPLRRHIYRIHFANIFLFLSISWLILAETDTILGLLAFLVAVFWRYSEPLAKLHHTQTRKERQIELS